MNIEIIYNGSGLYSSLCHCSHKIHITVYLIHFIFNAGKPCPQPILDFARLPHGGEVDFWGPSFIFFYLTQVFFDQW